MSPEENIKNIISTKAMGYLPYFLIILVLTLFLFYLGDKLTLNERNCNTLRDLYTSYPNIKSIDYNSDDFDYSLRDFYIKASYNSCCSGGVKNDYVNVCALENVLKNGVRFLDFEIYSKNDMPIIGASSSNEYSYKETYNDLAFKTAMEKVKDVAFSGVCPNPEDPIILHFRIKSEKSSICDVMAKDINHTFGQDHLDKLYSYEYRGKNLGEVKLKDLKKKVIIIVDKSEGIKFKSTKLYEFVNMCSGSEHLRKYRNNDIEYTVDTDEIIKFNKMNMSIVLPDVNVKTDNYSYVHAKETGVQIMAMNFQNFDSNLKFYSLFFDGTQSAFILKPEDMRADTYAPTTPDETPQLPSPDQSYGCPADQNACDISGGSSEVESYFVTTFAKPTPDGKSGGKWNKKMSFKEMRNHEPTKLKKVILKGLYIWRDNSTRDENKIISTNNEDYYYVDKCDDFNGVPGVNFYDQNVWANLYGNSLVHQNDNNNMNRYSKNEMRNSSTDAYKQYEEFGENYCKKAVYYNPKYEKYQKCKYKNSTVKGKPYGKKGDRNNAFNKLEGTLNYIWGKGDQDINIKDKDDIDYLFWNVQCQER